jgi:CelD/BcsL family acetyltransferase involved in cellulose biosynthesis
VQALDQALTRRGFEVSYGRRTAAPYIALPASFDAYLAQLKGGARAIVRKSVRDMEAWNGGPLTLHEVRDEASLDQGLAILDRLHGARWAEDGKPGVFASPLFKTFLAASSRELLAAGHLELLWLDSKDGPVAAVYNLIWDNKVFFYQSGRRMDLPGKLRPGSALHALAIRRAIAAGRREYDFMAGLQRYKLELATGQRELVDLHASAPSWRAQAQRRVAQATQALHSLRSHLQRLSG